MTLTDAPISLVRSLKGAPLACLFILLISGEALRAGELCQATGYSPNRITAALRLLSELHLLEKSPDGWRVPSPLRSTLLHQDAIHQDVVNRESPTSICESSALGGGDINSESLIVVPPPPLGIPTQSERSLLPTYNPQPTTVNRQLIPRILGTATGNAPLDIARILDATRLLFGERLHGPPSRYPDVRLLLAAIAEAYVRRHTLRKPARVAYANLKRGVDPGAEFLADPLAYLPVDFLAALGLTPLSPSASALASDESPVESDEQEDPPPEAHPSLALPADLQGRRSAAQVWEMARDVLRYELPRSAFHAYLEACWLAAYNPATSLFTIAVSDEQARLWLQDRLAPKLIRLLTGICDRPCSVRFEVVS